MNQNFLILPIIPAMIRVIICLIPFLLCKAHTYSQSKPPKKASYWVTSDSSLAAQVVSSNIIIELTKISPRKEKKTRKKGTYEGLLSYVQKLNTTRVAAFKAAWNIPFEQEVKKITPSELKTIPKEELKNAVILRVRWEVYSAVEKDYSRSRGDRDVDIRRSYYFYELLDGATGKSIAVISTLNRAESENEVIIKLSVLKGLVQQSQNGLVNKDYFKRNNEKSGQLKNKTLLIPAGATSLNFDEIQSIYGYKFSIASPRDIVEKILERDERYAFLLLTPSPTSVGDVALVTIFSCESSDPIITGFGVRTESDFFPNDPRILGTTPVIGGHLLSEHFELLMEIISSESLD